MILVVLGEDEWREGRRASLLGLGGASGVARTRWGGRHASLGMCGAGVGLEFYMHFFFFEILR